MVNSCLGRARAALMGTALKHMGESMQPMYKQGLCNLIGAFKPVSKRFPAGAMSALTGSSPPYIIQAPKWSSAAKLLKSYKEGAVLVPPSGPPHIYIFIFSPPSHLVVIRPCGDAGCRGSDTTSPW